VSAVCSSDKQKDEHTIESQTAALVECAANNDFSASLIRPGLEKLRDLAAEGQIQSVLVHSPDRLTRALRRGNGVSAGSATATSEDQLLVQFQEHSRRGKRHRARQGEVSALSGAP
jgi:site-specific DNA recombinase